MQQSVLLTAIRGPDGLNKNHVSKLLCRWLRRCILRVAFTGETFDDPFTEGGGSFTGPSITSLGPFATPMADLSWTQNISQVVTSYLERTDEIPHHFQLHFMHAAQILGYKHPNMTTRRWWLQTYHRLANDMHLIPEPEDVMDLRLGDVEAQWRAAEEVTASDPK